MAIFCLSTLFVGCDQKCVPHVDENADLTCDTCGEALEAPACKPHADENKDYVCDNCPETFIKPCEADHKDENADKHCDVCGLAIVVITEFVEPTPEERVDMIVNPIPENGSIKDYYSFVDYSTVISKAQKVEGNIVDVNYNNGYAYIVIPQENEVDGSFNKHVVKNLITDKTVYSTYDINKYVLIDISDFYFTVFENTYDEFGDVTNHVFKYLAYDESLLFDVVAAYEDTNLWEGVATYEKGSVTYLTFDNKVFAYDSYTGKLIREFNKAELVYRPDFDYETDKYGFVEMDNSVFVYDLTKWVDCVYSYTYPSFYENAEFFNISGDRILLQASVKLLDSAVSYDYIENGYKYDLIYMILDPAAKTETAVEFGYYIEVAGDRSDEDKTFNYVEAYPIVNDRIDKNNPLVLITDKDLKITLNLKNNSVDFVSDNVILVSEVIDVDEDYEVKITVEKLINATTGKLIAYVPEGAKIFSDYIYYDGVFYDFNMKAIFDLEKEGFSIWDWDPYYFITDNFALLTKIVEVPVEVDPNGVIYETYFFTAANKAVKIDIDDLGIAYVDDLGFVISHVKQNGTDEFTGEPLYETVYTFYNIENKPVFTSNSYIISVRNVIDNTYLIYTDDGARYIAQ